jgi:pimeloyl-ACP methyl ester carboxylesterase
MKPRTKPNVAVWKEFLMTTCRKLVCFALFVAVSIHSAGRASGQPEGPPPEIVTLTTRDGVQLKATYFPSTAGKGSDQAKQVAPVVLLHDYKSTGAALTQLALKLQAPVDAEHPSFAAFVVDLRGHGGSTKQLGPGGAQADLDAAKISKDGFVAMAALDMEAVRKFLVDKNDAGELNLNKLCLVGSGMGASVAANWAVQDWSAPPLAVGKQGQDVKALVLISPRWSFNGLSMQVPMKFAPLKMNAVWMLVCGSQDPKVKSDTARIEKQLERLHPKTDKTGAKRSGLEVLEVPTGLQGDSLISKSGDAVTEAIVKFLSENIAANPQPWLSRRNRLP